MSGAGKVRWALARQVVVLYLVAASSLAGEIARAQEPDLSRFRRILVPQDALESESRGLLPMKREDLEGRIRALAPPTGLAAGPSAARLESARFKASLRGSQLEGTAELTVVSPSD